MKKEAFYCSKEDNEPMNYCTVKKCYKKETIKTCV